VGDVFDDVEGVVVVEIVLGLVLKIVETEVMLFNDGVDALVVVPHDGFVDILGFDGDMNDVLGKGKLPDGEVGVVGV
jgi:hypothetical protein